MTSAHVKGVLDLTFADIKEENDLQTALTSERVLSIPLATTSSMNSPDKKKKAALEEVKAIRLANNEISSVSILSNPFTNFIDTAKISWLDLSFNRIEKLDESFVIAFPQVTTLYLQANQITRLTELKKLTGMGWYLYPIQSFLSSLFNLSYVCHSIRYSYCCDSHTFLRMNVSISPRFHRGRWLFLLVHFVLHLHLAFINIFLSLSISISLLSSGFPKLKSLAVYGNPVEEHKHYRNFVLFTCKALKNFDMSPGNLTT